MPTPQLTPMQKLTRRVQVLEDQIRMLQRTMEPTRVRRSLADWLNEQYPIKESPTDRIRDWRDRGNMVTVLAKQGVAKATMALWTRVFNPEDDGCPVRSFNVAPQNLYRAGPDGWVRMTPEDMKALYRATEQWFLRAIPAEHADGSEAGARLLDKVLTASADIARLRSGLGNYVRRRIHEVRVIEFDP